MLFVGVDFQLPSMTSCIGDEVTYTCTVDSVAHRWDTNDGVTATILIGDFLNATQVGGVYTLKRVEANSTSAIASTLSATAFAGLNGTLISCRDGLVAEGIAETRTARVMIFGEFIICGT